MSLFSRVFPVFFLLYFIAAPAVAETAYEGSYFKRVTLVVADMERSLEIYRDILGFHLDGISVSSSDSYSYPVFGIDPEAKIRFATLSAGTEQVRTLALTEVTGMDLPKPTLPYRTASVIRSRDIKKDFARLEALGLQTTDPKFVEGSGFSFWERAFVDPDGHLIVLYEIVAPELSAQKIVQKAIDAAGGEAWRRPGTLRLGGVSTIYEGRPADDPLVTDTYEMWRVFPSQSGAAHSANGKVRIDAMAAGKVIFQVAYDGEHTYNQNGLVPPEQAQRDWSAAFGFGILRFALDEGFSLERLPDDQIEGHACYFIRVQDPTGSHTIFAMDQADFSVRMVGFETPKGWHHRLYSEFKWHEEPRFRQPTRVRLYYDGVKTHDIEWRRFAVNEPIPDHVFVLSSKDES